MRFPDPLPSLLQRYATGVFVLLSGLLVIYPFHYFFGFAQIEALEVIIRPWVFAAILDAWVLFGVLSFRGLPLVGRVKEAVLVVLMSAIPGVITYKLAPLGVDHSYGITYYGSAYISQFGRVPFPPPPQVGYLEYPGIMLLTHFMSVVTGVPNTLAGSTLQIGMYIVLGGAIFQLTKLLTENTFLSSLAIPLFLFCSIEAGNFLLFFPATSGATLLILALFIVVRGPKGGASDKISFIVIFAAMTITHFYDPLDLMFVLAAMYLVNLGRRESRRFGVFLTFAVMGFTLYFILVATSFFNSVVPETVYSLTHLLLGVSQAYALQVISSNTVAVPVWAAFFKYLGVLITSIIGSMVALYHVLRVRSRGDSVPRVERTYYVAAVAILLFGLAIYLATFSSGGISADFYAALQWVVFFSIPIFLLSFSKRRRYVLIVAVCVAFMSAPTFYSLVIPQISTISVYPENVAAAIFVVHNSPSSSMTVFTDGKNSGVIGALDPNAVPDFYTIPSLAFAYKPSELNLVDLSYAYYQLHTYGVGINYSSIESVDVIYSSPRIYILPPQTT
jgi:hypothetical protein